MNTLTNNELGPLLDAIVSKGLVGPAIFFLEMGKPLVGCMRELYLMGEPLMVALFGSTLAPAIKQTLQSEESTEALIRLLETTRDSVRKVT